MKYFVMNVNLGIPLEEMVDEEQFKEEFNSDPIELEKHFTEFLGINAWLIEGDLGLKPVIQDVMIKDLSDGLYGHINKKNKSGE